MNEITVILTVWKRNHLEEQLISLLNQSKKPDVIWVQQTMKHVDVSEIIEKYQSYIKYPYFTENKGVFGRFESTVEVETEFTFILDDDMIPGENYVKIVWEACKRLNGIISSSGRIALPNRISCVGDSLKSKRSYCLRDMRVDFGTNSWFFQTQWIKYFVNQGWPLIRNSEEMEKKQDPVPLISILLPVYNVPLNYLRESVGSVLSQTFTNFDLLIVDDGSTDGCTKILSEFSDERIRLIDNHHNFIDSLNKGIKEAKGIYIAQMDADGVMLPQRLQTQYDFMQCHPEIDVCGSWAEQLDSASSAIQPPTTHNSIISSFIIENKVIHPSVMIRKEILEKIQYTEEYPCAEDYKLWTELALHGFRFANIPEVLLKYRISNSRESSTLREEISESTQKIQIEYIENIMEQMVEKNEFYESVLNPIINLTNDGLISWESLRQIVSLIYLDFLRREG